MTSSVSISTDRDGSDCCTKKCVVHWARIAYWLVVLTFCVPTVASADYLGLTAGYSASVKEHKERSVDVGLEIFDNYQLSAVRVNRKFNKKWIGSAHIGLYGEKDGSGFSTGLGAMYSLTDNNDIRKKYREKFKSLSRRWHFGLRASAQVALYEENERSLSAASAKVSLIGSTKNKPRDEKLLKWFTDIGLQVYTRETIQVADVRSESDIGLVVTGGIIYPFLVIGETVYGNQYGGEVFGAFSVGKGARMTFGFRYNFR